MTTILQVEDDEVLAGLVQSAFAAFGFRGQFLVASTPREAEGILAQQHLDLVISDMELPGGSGLDVVRMVRSDLEQSQVPILILSGHDDARMVSQAYNSARTATSRRGRVGGRRPRSCGRFTITGFRTRSCR